MGNASIEGQAAVLSDSRLIHEWPGLICAVPHEFFNECGKDSQVDPIGMAAANPEDPQSLNLYAYCGNDPVNSIDPEGLFFGKLLKWIGKALKILSIVALVVMTIIIFVPMRPPTIRLPPIAATSRKLQLMLTRSISVAQ